VTLTVRGPGVAVPPACGSNPSTGWVFLSFVGTAGGSASATTNVGGTPAPVALGATPVMVLPNAAGDVAITYTSSGGSGTDTVTAGNLASAPTATATDTYTKP
jgi:hypothetical protein